MNDGEANHISQVMEQARFHLVFVAEAITPVLIAFFISYLSFFILFGWKKERAAKCR